MQAIEWLKENVPGVSPETKQAARIRLIICKSCPQFVEGLGQCRECGCIMPVKVFFKTAACPLGKWGSTE